MSEGWGDLFGRLIHARERRHAARDTNRIVRPFEWGASFITGHANGDDPRRLLEQHTRRVLERSADFYALPAIGDYELHGDLLTWTSAIQTPAPENNTAHARFFPAQAKRSRRERRAVQAGANGAGGVERANGAGGFKNARGAGGVESADRVESAAGVEGNGRRAVVVLPQWNADSESHVSLCRLLNRLGIAALRLTLPYHEARRPAELERAEHLVSSNIGRTLQSMRQAVVDTRAAVGWLRAQGYERIGIVGTSIGSCTAFLAFVHEPAIDVGVFNHVSGYFADVVWHGISTQHVRAGFGDALTLEELRRHWLPISPLAYTSRLLQLPPRPMRFIAARYDLTFPRRLSCDVIEEVKRLGVPLDVSWLPCGHYTSAECPWVYLDGWKIVSFLRKHL